MNRSKVEGAGGALHVRATRLVAAMLLAGLLGLASDARAEWNGHLGFGYGKLFATDAPGGSLSVSAGMDVPLAPDLRIGADVGYHLLGSRTIERGSLLATLDYSVFDMALLLHWQPPNAGPLGRVSIGPALMSARAELSTSGGGAAFSDLAVEELVPAFALDATLMTRSASPVRIGFQVGTRVGFLPDETWTLATAHFAIHY